jgi:hypothetical protein
MKKLLTLAAIVFFIYTSQTYAQAVTPTDPAPVTFSVTQLWSTDTVMKTPESVLYDPARNVIYVANMNRKGTGDEKGFISKLKPDGTIVDLHWIAGVKEPRGMGIHGNLLFATDMDRLLIIDLKKGKLKSVVPIEGAQFLNDLSIDKSGAVYCSDSRAGVIYKYEKGKISSWLTGLNNPNGLFDLDDKIFISVVGEEEVRLVDKLTFEYEVVADKVRVDGIEYTGIENYFLFSEWPGRIHVIGDNSIQKILDTSQQKISSADIGFDKTNGIIFVPTFNSNTVTAYKLIMN